jgi:phage shock protein E
MNMIRRRVGAVLVVGAVAGGLLVGCSSGGSGGGSVSASEVQNGSTLSVDDFASVIGQDGVVVLDVRTPEEFAEGHLTGATNIDVEAPTFAQDVAGLDKGTTYAVYCHTGNRSKVAMQAMVAAGFTHVVDLDGGIADWSQAGQPVVTD